MSTKSKSSDNRERNPRDTPDSDETPDVHYLHAPILREQAEPRDGLEPVPIWLTLFYGIVVFIGGFYLAANSGGFRADVYDERNVGGTVSTAAKEELSPLEKGKRLYVTNCAACHQQSGKGVAGQFPPLTGSEWVTGEAGILIRILLNGLQGPIQVAGDTYNGNMPAFGEKLDDEELALLLTYIRQSWDNEASAISAEWISLVRENTKDRTAAWTADDLKQVTPETKPPPRTEPMPMVNPPEETPSPGSQDSAKEG